MMSDVNKKLVLLILPSLLGILLASSSASAQYKKRSFGFDTGYWFVLKNPTQDAATGDYVENPPFRAGDGFFLGAEANFKLTDRWWVNTFFKFGIFQFAGGIDGPDATADQLFDADAATHLGVLLALNPGTSIRYFFATDRIRPYAQLGLSYMNIQPTGSTWGNPCRLVEASFCFERDQDGDIIPNGPTNRDAFLPQTGNLPIFHLRPGIEFIVARDVALNIYADAQYWLLLNTPNSGNFALSAGIGVNFYSD